MISHLGLSESQSSPVSTILLGVLADLSNVVVWMISIRPLISNSSSPCSQPLGIVPSPEIRIGITFHSFLYSLTRSTYASFFSCFDFHSVVCLNGQVYPSANFLWLSFFISRSDVIPVLGDMVESKIPETFMRLTVLDGFWCVLLLFGIMATIQFIEQ